MWSRFRPAAPLRRASTRTIRLAKDPESQDASKVQALKVSDQFDLVENSFLGAGEHVDVRAGNVNTIDEVPDSSWFTNRVGAGTGPLDLGGARQGP